MAVCYGELWNYTNGGFFLIILTTPKKLIQYPLRPNYPTYIEIINTDKVFLLSLVISDGVHISIRKVFFDEEAGAILDIFPTCSDWAVNNMSISS